ncbi:serine/threonine-protein kinase [Bradyrhizobium sp. UFLA05-112]
MNPSSVGSVAPVGYVLGGRFDLVEVIGVGGISTVYRATDRIGLWAREPNPEVAVKVIRPHPRMRQELIGLLHREARLLRMVVHRNLVRIYDSDYDGKYHYLVMEFLKGRSLAQILIENQGRPLSPAVSFRIIRAAGRGLAHIHRFGLVHGDLKPGNIFMTSDGAIKILDFGAVLTLEAAPLTERGAALPDQIALMTPAYASPEMLMGEPRAESDDVYSLAVVAYLVLTGMHPYAHRPADEALYDKLTPAPPSTISTAQWRALASGLALNRRDRIQTVSEFVQSLTRPPWFYRLWGGARHAAVVKRVRK